MKSSPAKTPAFVVRLSAIGDTLIAVKALQRLADYGFEPVLVTTKLQLDVACSVRCLNRFLIAESDGTFTAYVRSAEDFKQSDGPFDFLAQDNFESLALIDLQATGRSRRCVRALKPHLKAWPTRFFVVPKRSLFRNRLVVKSYFARKQTARPFDANSSSYERIADIQANLIDSVALAFNRTATQNASTLPTPTHLLTLPQANLARFSFADAQYVALFPGASGPLKEWPKEHFKKCIELLLQRPDVHVVVCGAKSEAELGAYLSTVSTSRVRNVVGQTSLLETLHIISKAQHVVTGDSFATHAADLLNVPATVIFGATSPLFGFAPRKDNINVEYLNLSCSPCTRHGKGDCRFGNLKCLALLSPNRIVDTITRL